MRIHGVLMVRDGVATLRVCLLHHLALGCEHIHVLDNGSTDATPVVLARLARKLPISWSRDGGPFRQHEAVTALAHEAARRGADWVLPIDDDEFWVGALRDVLAEADGAAALAARVTCFAQRRRVRRASPRALLTMDHRAPRPDEPVRAQALVEAGALSFLEYAYPPKLVLRASERVQLARGAHAAEGLDGPIASTSRLEVLHAPIAAQGVLQRKAEHGARLEAAGFVEREGWHVRRWAALARQGLLEAEWPSLSVDGGGCVVVGGQRRQFVRDGRLAEAVARWVRPPHEQAAARALRRSF